MDKEGILIVQGGGNSLEGKGARVTVGRIVKGINYFKERNTSTAIWVMGLLPRVSEGQEYEKERKLTNTWIQMEIRAMNEGREEGAAIGYIDPDYKLDVDYCFQWDMIHLNQSGKRVIEDKINQALRGTEIKRSRVRGGGMQMGGTSSRGGYEERGRLGNR